MRTALMLALLTCLAAPVQAAQPIYNRLVAEQSSLQFVARLMGSPTEGRFARFNAQVNFDPAQPQQTHARIDVDIASIDAGGAEANTEVKSRGWFNLASYPTASFVMSTLKPLGKDRFEAVGKLTIKGRVLDVVIPVQARIHGGQALLEGSLPVRRLQFGIGDGIWSDTDAVADEVQVRFRLTLATGSTNTVAPRAR
jgi:polyisoprenoid-binding protein YceI